MLTEATLVCENGHGYPCTPGIYTEAQMEAWKPIVTAVQKVGAVFFCQIWHCGRASHSSYHNGAIASPCDQAQALNGLLACLLACFTRCFLAWKAAFDVVRSATLVSNG
jgi:2,4-dienoyl-CoA reductase-like NADH-dependent reductase (Old Yellow Enzyme family)